MQECPCGSGRDFAECCQKFINNHEVPATPEQLMRSRYTAYTLRDLDYIARTMKEPANIGFSPDDVREWSKRIKWLRLEVVTSSYKNSTGFVEFIAHYKDQGKKMVMHEVSEFRLDEGRWYYISGVQKEGRK